MRVQRILCPIDFSASSDAAMREAVDLAKQFDATLELFHVYHATGYGGPGHNRPVALNDLIEWVDRTLAAWRREAEALGARKVQTRSVEGVAWDEIVMRSSEGDFDTIVIGTRGLSGIKHLLLGSTAERVVRHAHCRVLTVREEPLEALAAMQ